VDVDRRSRVRLTGARSCWPDAQATLEVPPSLARPANVRQLVAPPAIVTYVQSKRTRPPVLAAAVGGNPHRLARVRTPFILERANPSKDGDAKRQTLGTKSLWRLLCRRDGRKAMSPSVPDLRHQDVARSLSRPGDRYHRFRGGLPCFFFSRTAPLRPVANHSERRRILDLACYNIPSSYALD
jgi:hypothetical protein